MDYKTILAGIGIVIGFISYASYFKGIFRGQTKPHVFSWFIWATINITAFFAQLVRGGGAGALITGVNGTLCIAVAIISISRGEKNITRSDWFSLAGAIAAITGWVLTADPLIAVILICITDTFGLIPTYRKAYRKPYEENAFAFGIDLVKFALELIALGSFNPTTALFPLTILVGDSFLVSMILIRRRGIIKRVNS